MEGVVGGVSFFRRNTRKKPVPKRCARSGNSREILVSLLMTVVIIFCSLLCAWSHIRVVNIGYEISQANKERKQLLQLNKKLKLEIATLKSLHHVEGIAKRDLRLRSPEKHQLVIIK